MSAPAQPADMAALMAAAERAGAARCDAVAAAEAGMPVVVPLAPGAEPGHAGPAPGYPDRT